MKFSLVPQAEAHVLYVASPADVQEFSGPNPELLAEPFYHQSTITLMVLVAFAVAFITYGVLRSKPLMTALRAAVHRAASYYDLVPWMMRLSLGIALIGAGVSGYLLSPTLANFPGFAFLQILTGFLFMAGFLLAPAVILMILLFLAALSQSVYMLGSLEMLALAVALLIMDARRPGVDHIFNIPAFQIRAWRGYVPVVLRIGMGVSLTFLAFYEKFLNPMLAARVVETTHLTSVIAVSPALWVVGSGIVELVLGVMILFGVWTRLAAAVTFLVLSLSFFYFGESVASHITLFGILSVLFVTGGKKLK